jgi:hypothetical protein
MAISVKLIGVKEVNKRLSNLRKYAIQVANAPVPTLVTGQAVDASVEMAREVYKTPSGKPKYPLRWKSDKQRKYVMAMLRKENNLPYRRTGRLETAWAGSSTVKQVTIANTARDKRKGQFIAPFVIGAFQQPFHADTGWQKRSAAIEKKIIKPILVDIRKQAKDGLEKSKNG